MVLRLSFMGTPDFSVPILQALLDAGHDIAAVYSQPPRPAGRRGLKLIPSPVQNLAKAKSIPVFTPQTLKTAEQQTKFTELAVDVAIVVAYGLLLPKTILETPRFGCFNAHASLLPRWRGAAPIQRAIMAGDKETGMTIMKMDEGLDTGPIALSCAIPITDNTTTNELAHKLSHIGADLMIEMLSALEKGQLKLTAQSGENITYASKIKKEETRIDWTKPAEFIHRYIRALSPFPGCWCNMNIAGREERVKILGSRLTTRPSLEIGRIEKGPDSLLIHCGQGCLEVTYLQRSGGKVLECATFLQGAHISAVF
ncbi:methionyl-tRNA formyltransferase [Bartonella henselae]|uniref:Methionyl-tRNA formyltransferase n=3 Tax=Bartonella TaxID=773 RepID=FMT_BARHE|nr:methionyl-tRNA formyltransferase [Bartonella henselae]Q6G5F1.1 RecName: Full=Methionyl-tRNA formyltransferase [Bartonella henselae str. Houston-1]ATP11724.1 methionyl-tRNA formyltransferase [Bartonella henselae]ETS09258.1 methionyl-tRNA formyltransferase [Bartonella henselae JK 50]ETS09415.1 methionyl-tRNA formyltransferase [Bartonella henselae JK 51]ETS09696.1 methionyl-tRNA formyltransferase [Bartonella henselae JK 42]ETS12724.1 methionyl-tRNA formyltransferase [Bartonella henselae JK 41